MVPSPIAAWEGLATGKAAPAKSAIEKANLRDMAEFPLHGEPTENTNL
jgi:hypothetical protein